MGITMEAGDQPFFKDGFYIYSTGEMVNEGDLIEGAQSTDNSDIYDYTEDEIQAE